MPRLVVNPGSATAWEIQLKPGDNFIGRGFSNDFKLTDPSVSGSHCQITVSDGAIIIKDLGSTNGTYINRAPVREAVLQTGQALRLGGVDMVFYADEASIAPATKTAPAVRMVGAPVRATTAPVAVKAAVTTTTLPEPAPPVPPPIVDRGVAPGVPAGLHHCKYHPRTAARFFCGRCEHYFCELCVNTRQEGANAGKYCRVCGTECAPVWVPPPQIAQQEGKGLSQLFTAFGYPFQGDGLWLVGAGTVFFCVLEAAQFLAAFAPLIGGAAAIILSVLGTGYLTAYMRGVVTGTAMGESNMPDWPDVTDVGSDVILPFLQLIGTVLVCFLPAIGIGILANYVDVPVLWAIVVAVVFGCIYFPMAFLAVAMLDSVVAANPLVVAPAILRVPLPYLVVLGIFAALIAVRAGGELLLPKFLPVPFVPTIILSFIGLYLLTVEMRVLGLLYLTNKAKFGWLAR